MSRKNTNAAPALEGRSGAVRANQSAPQAYLIGRGAATTANAEHSLDGRSSFASLAATVPAIESHVSTHRSTSMPGAI